MNFRTNLMLMCAFIFITINTLSAQKVFVEWGNESDQGDSKSLNHPLGWEDGTYYNLRMDYNVYKNNYDAYIESVDKNKNLRGSSIGL